MLSLRRVGGSTHATEKETERFLEAQGSRLNRICWIEYCARNPIMTLLLERYATFERSARENSLRRRRFPESNCSSGFSMQNDFLFNYPRIDLLEFSHDPTGQSHVS
jgi:hypothetical protein